MTVTHFIPTAEQAQAIEAIIEFWRKKRRMFVLGGLAGVGKTCIVAEIVRQVRHEGAGGEKLASLRIAFACYTGKAADVLRRKLLAAGVYEATDYCGTIHGLIYEPRTNKNGEVIGWRRKDAIEYDLIVVDEASMVNEEIHLDLTLYRRPILYVGDHGQLPPIQGELNLMAKADVRLERIHRQAADNPIIRLAMMVRQDGYIPVGEYGQYVRKVNDFNIIDRIADPGTATVLCGFNAFRVNMNARVRGLLGIVDPDPVVGDRVICLRNDRTEGVYNGQTGVLEAIEERDDISWSARVAFDGGGQVWSGRMSREQFGNQTTLPYRSVPKDVQLFDWAYCMTTHKAQGSEWSRVIVYEQRNSYQDDDMWRRWLYTAITRASERLLIVGS